MSMVRSDRGYIYSERGDLDFAREYSPRMSINLTVSYGDQKKEYAAYSNTIALSEYGMESNMLNELKTKRQKASAGGRSQSEIDEENRGKDLMLALITLVDDKILEAPRLAEEARIKAKEDRYAKNAEQDAARKAASQKKADALQHIDESFNNLMQRMNSSRG